MGGRKYGDNTVKGRN